MKIESRLGKGLSTFFENKQPEVPVFQNPNSETLKNEENGIRQSFGGCHFCICLKFGSVFFSLCLNFLDKQ